MYENNKLDEAKYFYQKMIKEFDDRQGFTYNLSAFLSSARSVLQYANEEAKTKQGGQRWYDQRVGQSNVLSFFKDKRDINIHDKPIHPTKLTSFAPTVTIGIKLKASVVVRDAQGNIKSQSSTETPQTAAKPPVTQAPAEVKVLYLFSDWTGSEDVVALCQKYIDELEKFIADGIKQGFITG